MSATSRGPLSEQSIEPIAKLPLQVLDVLVTEAEARGVTALSVARPRTWCRLEADRTWCPPSGGPSVGSAFRRTW